MVVIIFRPLKQIEVQFPSFLGGQGVGNFKWYEAWPQLMVVYREVSNFANSLGKLIRSMVGLLMIYSKLLLEDSVLSTHDHCSVPLPKSCLVRDFGS